MATYQAALRALQPVINPVFRALSAGLDEASRMHESASFKRSDDPWFYAHAARRTACDRLRAEGLQAEVEDGRPALALSGLLVFYRDFAVRVIRPSLTRSGQMVIPVPGRSVPRKQFWRQEPAFPGMRTDNLLLLWQDADGILVEPMKLVRPTGGDHRRASLRFQWAGPVTRAMATFRAADLDALTPEVAYEKLGDEEAG